MRGAWQKLAALAVLALAITAAIIWRRRLGADFIPLDASRVGPNLLAAAVQAAVVFVIVVALWPPWRARLHRLIDSKLAPLHAKVDRLHARHDHHAEHLDKIAASLDDAHRKLDKLGREP